jgi:hypothetical protein
MKTCAACGREAETLVTNTLTWRPECQRCCMGEDQMMLRRVTLTTERGTKTHVVRALNNLEAFRMLWREDVLEGFAVPLAN